MKNRPFLTAAAAAATGVGYYLFRQQQHKRDEESAAYEALYQKGITPSATSGTSDEGGAKALDLPGSRNIQHTMRDEIRKQTELGMEAIKEYLIFH